MPKLPHFLDQQNHSRGGLKSGLLGENSGCMVAPLERLRSRSELLVLEHGCGHRPEGTAPSVSPAQVGWPELLRLRR